MIDNKFPGAQKGPNVPLVVEQVTTTRPICPELPLSYEPPHLSAAKPKEGSNLANLQQVAIFFPWGQLLNHSCISDNIYKPNLSECQVFFYNLLIAQELGACLRVDFDAKKRIFIAQIGTGAKEGNRHGEIGYVRRGTDR